MTHNSLVSDHPSTLWGITQLNAPEKLPQKISFIEYREHPDLKPRKPIPGQAFSLNLSFWYLSSKEESEHGERQSLLIETCQKQSPRVCTLNLPPSMATRPEMPARVNLLIKEMQSQGLCPIYFDFGRLPPPSWIDPKACVSDPLWDPGSIFGDYWKIHGWHLERWVRLYPLSELQKLKLLASRHLPKFVILAHSSRFKQLKQLTTI